MPVQLPDSARRLGDSVPLINGGEPIQALHPAQNTGKRKEKKQEGTLAIPGGIDGLVLSSVKDNPTSRKF
jgi:hypothetical protein